LRAAVARGDADIIALVQEYDARGQPIVIPALALAGASLDTRSEEGDDLLLAWNSSRPSPLPR
jgi:hypothetical protein